MIWPFFLWTALSGLAGLFFLLRAATIRWRPAQAGWRMALFAAGFGLIGLTVLTPGDVTPLGALARLIGATAEVFVGMTALRAARR